MFDPSSFTFFITDHTTGQTYTCLFPKCIAKVDPNNPKALIITFDKNLQIFKGSAKVTYSISSLSVKAQQQRLLQTGNPNATGSFEIDNLHLVGNLTRNSQKVAYNAFTAINAIRFFSTLILSVLNTAHAFWATSMFSWLQVWGLLRGDYLVYPERFLAGHSDWFLLVINFGEPWKNWNDWDKGTFRCRVDEEFPLSKLGCSMTDTFGQNIIVIICVFGFCLIFGILYLIWGRKANGGQTPTSNANMTWGQRFTMGLGFTYFLRWLQAIQPSLIFFCITQWYSFANSSRMGLGVFWSIFFFIYFFAVALFSVFLAFKVWGEVRDNKEGNHDQTVEWTARRVGGFFSPYGFLYCDLKTVTGLWQLFYPLVDFLRAILVAVFIVAVNKNNKTSLGLVLLVELLRIGYHTALFRNKTSTIYAIQDFISGLLLILYLILKNSVEDEPNQRRAQEAAGSAMALFIGMIWALCLFDMIYDLFVGLSIFTDEKPKLEEVSPHKEPVANHDNSRPEQSYRMGDQSRNDMDEGPSENRGARLMPTKPMASTADQEGAKLANVDSPAS